MDAGTKYNVASCLVWTSIIACTLSFAAIFMAYPTASCCRPDANSVIVDVLAILITVLMGWNIYTVIDTKSEVNKLKEERARLQEYIKANRNYAIGITNSTNGKYGTAVGFLCSAAVKFNKINETEPTKDCLDIINTTIEDHKSGIRDIFYLEAIYKEIKFDFKKINDDRIEDISKNIEEILSTGNKNNKSKTANKAMKIKYIVKDVASREMMFLVRDVEMSGQIAPFAFLNCEKKNYSAAKFDTKDEAIKACEEAKKYDGGSYTPVILETLVEDSLD